MSRIALHRKQRRLKKAKARERHVQEAAQLTVQLRDRRTIDLIFRQMMPMRPDLAALSEPIFPPPPSTPAERFALAMGRVAAQRISQCTV
ncbi:MAG: hypothetical protein ACRDHZ_25545 [Ktedonobacteraceae bacterium]